MKQVPVAKGASINEPICYMVKEHSCMILVLPQDMKTALHCNNCDAKLPSREAAERPQNCVKPCRGLFRHTDASDSASSASSGGRKVPDVSDRPRG